MSKTISLTQGKVALVSDEDFDRVNQFKWCFSHGYGYRKADHGTKTQYMHRFILGAQKDDEVDHKNQNKLDNRRENLRFCSRSENSANKGKQKNSTTGYMGVSWNKNRQKYKAYIVCEGTQHELGFYDDKHEAAEAYNKKALLIYGEFAYLNRIKENV
jgi:hypothetical protein